MAFLFDSETLKLLEVVCDIDGQKFSRVVNRAIYFSRSGNEWEKTKKEYKKKSTYHRTKLKVYKKTNKKKQNHFKQDARSLFDTSLRRD